MQIEYELTQNDFYESFIAHRNRSAFVKWILRVLIAFLFTFVAGGLVLLFVRPNRETFSNLVPLFVLSLAWAGFLWACPWWMARTQFLKQPAAQGPKMLLLDDTGVHWRWTGGSSDVEWRTFIRWLESKNDFIVYQSPIVFHMIPKRAMTPEQVTEFRNLLSRNISSRK